MAAGAAVVGAGAGVMAPTPHPISAARAAQSDWAGEAEQTFRLGRGAGRQLMTQEEWREHQQKMKSMSQSERERYREEWHQKMTERAREKGITLPDTPRPRQRSGTKQRSRSWPAGFRKRAGRGPIAALKTV